MKTVDRGMFLPVKRFSNHPESTPVLTVGPVNIVARATMERKRPSPQKQGLVCAKERKRNFQNNTCLSSSAHFPCLFPAAWNAS